MKLGRPLQAVARRHRLVVRCVAVDEPICQHRAEPDREDQDQQDQHGLGIVLTFTTLASEEAFEQLADCIGKRSHRVIGVVGHSEGVVPRCGHACHRPLFTTIVARPPIEGDCPSRDQHEGDDQHVASVHEQLERVVVQDALGVRQPPQKDENAPGEADVGHDRTAPDGEPSPATVVFAFDPRTADGIGVPERDRQVDDPDDDDCSHEVFLSRVTDTNVRITSYI